VFVTVAAYTHYITLHEYLDYRTRMGCSEPTATAAAAAVTE
jgi:hypothetical protein